MKKKKQPVFNTEQKADDLMIVFTPENFAQEQSRSSRRNVKKSKRKKPAYKHDALLKLIDKSLIEADESCNAAENHFQFEFVGFLNQ